MFQTQRSSSRLNENTTISMSSPWKQLERRLPALPGYPSQSAFTNSSGSANLSLSALHTGTSMEQSQGQGIRPHTTKDPRSEPRTMAYQTGVLTTPSEIKQYLRENPWLVEEYVTQHHTAEDVQKWFDDAKSKAADRDNQKNKKATSFRDGNLLCAGMGEDIKTFLVDMVERVEDQDNIPEVLYQLSHNIATAVKADEAFLFMISAQDESLYLCSDMEDCIQLVPFAPITLGTNIVAHVAHSLQPVLSSDILGDERFPQGTGRDGSLAKSVLCLPLIQPNGDILAVVELSRNISNQPFTQLDMQLASTYFTWVGIGLDKIQVCNGLMKQREFNDFLLEVSRVIFDDIVSIDSLSQHIMMFAKSLVNADRCALFLVDTQTDELYADLFDEGLDKDGKPVFLKKNQIRFPVSRGIAGLVAKTGEVVSIADAYQDPRFNREVDVQTGYATRCILCMPIVSHGIVIGVVQMINKIGADGQPTPFDQTDESNFRMFSMYCALALHYSKVYSENQQCERQLAVAQEQLTHYTSCSEQQVDRLLNNWYKENYILPPEIEKFEFHSRPYVTSLCEIFIYMTQRLFGPTSFDLTTLARFILTVRKNYRLIPFHNFCHAFDVCHCIFLCLLESKGKFSDLEMYAMYFGAICHDIDHRSLTNSFHKKFGTPLGLLYSTSIMEHHHAYMTMDILHREGHNIFSHLPLNAFKQLTALLNEMILSTDLTTFFGHHKELAKMIVSQSLDWSNENHRSHIRSMYMTASDLCATTKLWPVQQQIVDCLYEEFYGQGDEEKRRGTTPITMLDRNNLPNLAHEQVSFLTNICIPCFKAMADLVPSTSPLLAGANDNLGQWRLEAEGKKASMWDVEASRVNKP